jgi:predicted nucleotidyltransferase
MKTRRTTGGRVLSASETRKSMLGAMKLFGEWYAKSNKPNIIFACVSGSHAYGFATTESDIDVRGIWLANAEDFFELSPPTPNSKKSTIESHGEDIDVELQELNKFVHLALKNNPNILDALFVPEPMILMKSAIYDELRAAMPIILNRTKIFHAYRGYALQQFSRMKSQYTDSKEKEISVPVFDDEEYQEKLIEMRKKHDRNDWDSLLQRKITIKVEVPVPEAERKLNVKNAAHLLRLLATGEHVLRTGEMRIIPPNKEFIVQVRKGIVPWDEIMVERDRLEKAMEDAYEKSVVNDDMQVSREWANDFLIKVRKNQLT